MQDPLGHGAVTPCQTLLESHLSAVDALLDAGAGLVEDLGEVCGFMGLVALVRDDRSYASDPRGGAIGLAGIALVADGGARRDVGSDVEQDGEMRRIRLLAAGQIEGDDGARCI